MSGFSMEQPMMMTGVVNGFATFGPLQPMPYFGPQISAIGGWPSRYLGIYDPVSTERPCGGYGGYDAAANEARRLMEAGWNSPTNLNDPFERVNTSALNYPFEKPRYREPSSFIPQIPSTPETRDPVQRALDNFYGGRERREQAEREQWNKINLNPLGFLKEIEAASIVRQMDPLTVFEQTGYSHFSYVDPSSRRARDPGFHETTQIPGIGSDVGLDKVLSLHTYIKPDRKGNLVFDTRL